MTDTKIAEYSPVAAGLAQLRHRFEGVVFDVTTTNGDKEARAARRELVTLRTSLEAKRKELKAPALEKARLIDSEAARIRDEIEALEKPIDETIRLEESRREAERQAKIRAEQARVAGIQAQIDRFRLMVLGSTRMSADDLSSLIYDLSAIPIEPDQFAEFQEAARAAKESALAELEHMRTAALERETEATRIAEERRQLEAEKAAEAAKRQAEREAHQKEMALQQAALDAQRAELNRQAAEQLAIEKQRQEAAAAAAAEAERVRQAELEHQEQLRREQAAQLKREQEAWKAQREQALVDAADFVAALGARSPDDRPTASEWAGLIGRANDLAQRLVENQTELA